MSNVRTSPVSYTTVETVLEMMPSIGSITTITSATIALFAGQAEARINAALSQQYLIPITGRIPVIEAVAADLTLYGLLAKRVFTGEQMNKSDWPDRFKEAVGLLDKIASGEMELLDSSGSSIAVRETGGAELWSNTMNYTPTFLEDDPERSYVDTAKLNEMGDRRD